MTDKKSGSSTLMSCLVVVVVGSVVFVGISLCCMGCGLGALYAAPGMVIEMLVGWTLQPAPVSVPALNADPVMAEQLPIRICQELVTTKKTTVSIDEMNQLIIPAVAADDDIKLLQLSVTPNDELMVSGSMALDDFDGQYLNMTCATSFDMHHGWFTRVSIGECTVGSWDLGQYMVGEEISSNFNSSLAEQRGKEPDLAKALDHIVNFEFTQGAFHLKVDDTALADMGLCGQGTAQ